MEKGSTGALFCYCRRCESARSGEDGRQAVGNPCLHPGLHPGHARSAQKTCGKAASSGSAGLPRKPDTRCACVIHQQHRPQPDPAYVRPLRTGSGAVRCQSGPLRRPLGGYSRQSYASQPRYIDPEVPNRGFAQSTLGFSLCPTLPNVAMPCTCGALFSGQGEIPYRWLQPTSGLCPWHRCQQTRRDSGADGHSPDEREWRVPRCRLSGARVRVCSSALGHMRA